MNYQVTMKEIPEVIIYSTKATLASFAECFQLIPEIGEKVAAKYPDLKCRSGILFY